MNATGAELVRYLRTLAAGRGNDACTDQQLLEQFVTRREQTAFAALVRRHGPMVLGVCRRVVGHDQDAEDAFQATFLILARKAGSIHKHESLGSWLHSVAFHVAERLRAKEARRSVHERKTRSCPPLDPAEGVAWGEIRCLLDNELARLPEQFRAPLVLCYLQGKTQDEAARHLEWSLSTFCRRLDRARQLLASRLKGRGLTLSAALLAPVLIQNTEAAGASSLLVAKTARAGLAFATGQPTGAFASASVLALAEGGQAFLTSKLKWVLAVLVAMSLAAGGILTHQALAIGSPATQPVSLPVPPPQPQPEVAIEEKGGTISVTGRVLDPDGKPFEGAKIYLIGSGDRPKKHRVRAVSGPEGRFHFTFPKTEYFEAGWIRERAEMWRWCDIVAVAPGYSPVNAYMADIKKELSLRLVKDARIDGRVRDLEGRPVPGAEVRLIGSSWSSLLNGVTTDKEGRFSLSGVGCDREEELRVSAPTIETQWKKVKTPSEGPGVVEFLAGPTKPVEGIIRGRDSGKPLAGVQIWAKLDGWPRGEDESHLLRTVTDAHGRYRLLGMPKKALYELTVVPPVESSYVITAKQAVDSTGLDPIRLDFDLTQGTIIRFRLIDKETGQPVRGNAHYSPLMDNHFWLEATHLEPGTFPPRVFFYYHDPDKDGFIQFVAYPGPGIIYVHAGSGNPTYLNARLDPEDVRSGHYPGMKGDELNLFLQIAPGYRRIDPKPTDRQLVFNILLDPGRTLKGTLVDPEGRPVRGARAWGLRLANTPQGTAREGEHVADDVPIEGRVLDLEGKPIAGVPIQVRSIARRADGKDLAAFVETVKKHLKDGTPEFLSEAYQPGALNAALNKFEWQRLAPTGLEVPSTVTTDGDGRFRLTGFGRDRILELVIRGSTIGHSLLHALTRNGPAKGWIPGHWGLYGARFEWLAAPCKPIIGTVRDKRTGKPLGGITVGVSGPMWTEAKTDKLGRYCILGAAKSKEYDVTAGEMPYFNCSDNHVADTPGLEPITVDFELERGILIRGRLTDKTTREPVRGEIEYVALTENPHLKDFVDASKRAFVSNRSGWTAPDGSFAVTVIPGPGLLLVTAHDVNRFAAAEDKGWITTTRFSLPHAVIPINPSEEDPKSTTCDIVLEPAGILKGSVYGPDNRPLDGVYVGGCWPIIHQDLFDHERLNSNTFTVGGLKPGRPRVLAFYNREKSLGKVLRLHGDEAKPLNVHLEPLGAIAGRVLDDKGRPWAGLKVLVVVTRKDRTFPPEFGWGPSSWIKLTQFETTTDREGRFRIDGLLPGLKYDLFAAEGEIVIRPGVALPYRTDDLSVQSGKTKNLGDLKSKLLPEKEVKEKR
jgi:RNA polymerase sigma factor (sigma-70 family)